MICGAFFKTIVRGENNPKFNNNPVNIRNNEPAGLPKTSNVARSNSLRSSSPPRVRRQHPNVPPPLPENEVLVMNQSLVPQHLPQYPTPISTQTKLDYNSKFVSCTKLRGFFLIKLDLMFNNC